MRSTLVKVLAVLLVLETGIGVGVLLNAAVDSDAPRRAAAPAAVGRFAIGVNLSTGPSVAAVRAWCRLVGAPPAVLMWYESWSEPLIYPDQMHSIRATGVTPMITWEPVLRSGKVVPMTAIADGKYDSYLRASARSVVALGEPVLIRFAHEMNLPSSPYGAASRTSPAEYVAAWRHVVTVFRTAGASSASFVWSPNTDCGGRCPFVRYFPGDAWIDWAGLDGYNTGGAGNWLTLRQVFASSYRRLARLTRRPLMLAEIASGEAGGSKADWIRQGLLHTVPTLFQRVRLVVWFDRDKEEDWRVNSTRSALDSFRAVLRSPLIASAHPSVHCRAGGVA